MPRKRRRRRNHQQRVNMSKASVPKASMTRVSDPNASIAQKLAHDYNNAVAIDTSFMDDEYWVRPARLRKRMEEMSRISLDYWVSFEDKPEDDEDCAAIHIYKFTDNSIAVSGGVYGYEACYHFLQSRCFPIPEWVTDAMRRANSRHTKHPDNKHIVHRYKWNSEIIIEHFVGDIIERGDCSICHDRFDSGSHPPAEWLAAIPE